MRKQCLFFSPAFNEPEPDTPGSPCNKLSIILWKMAGAEATPNGKRLNMGVNSEKLLTVLLHLYLRALSCSLAFPCSHDHTPTLPTLPNYTSMFPCSPDHTHRSKFACYNIIAHFSAFQVAAATMASLQSKSTCIHLVLII